MPFSRGIEFSARPFTSLSSFTDKTSSSGSGSKEVAEERETADLQKLN